MATKCNACGGIYNSILADKVEYYHVCPPIVDAKTGATTTRPNARNENISIDTATGKAPIIAEGAGVEAVAAAPPA